MESSTKAEEGEVSARTANVIGTVLISIFLLMCLDSYVTERLERKTTFLKERISQVIIANQ